MPVVNDYTALLSGSYWNGFEVTGKPVVITYSFPDSAPSYDAAVQGFTADTPQSFQAFSAAEQQMARDALGEWAAASGLVFVEVAPGKGDINFQKVDLGTTAYDGAGGVGFYPFGSWDGFSYPSFRSGLSASGDIFMTTQFPIAYGTLLHEIGHAIGLKHPTETVYDGPAGVNHDEVLSSDDPNRTIMAESTETAGTTDHLKSLDKKAAAYIYGRAGNGAVVTGDASGSNSAVSSWTWDAANEILTQRGFARDDVMRGSSVTDSMSGLNGNDRLFGLDGDDTLSGGDGNDLLDGGPGDDTMRGGLGNDTYVVDDATDKAIESADAGFDYVYAFSDFTLGANVEALQLFGDGLVGRGNALGNSLFGDGTHANKLYGLGGQDYMVAGAGNDVVNGGVDNDTIYTGAGADIVKGGDGDDYLVGGAGVDQITGGTGSDTFVLSNLAPDRDTIRDFEAGIDRLQIDVDLFGGGLQPGALDPTQFEANASGTGATTENRFVYNTSTGALYFDLNGSDPGGRQQIATLTGAPALTADSFSLVRFAS